MLRCAPFRDRRDQWYLPELASTARIEYRVNRCYLPTLTWGLVRSKAVAKERAAYRSLERTWCTGLAARGRNKEDLLLLKRRLTDLVMPAIVYSSIRRNQSMNGMNKERKKTRQERKNDGMMEMFTARPVLRLSSRASAQNF